MQRKLASIQRIKNIRDIKDADKIQVCNVLGWEVVILKNEFKENDLCIYCEVDSILPDKPEFEFLRERKFRIRTIKLRGQVSQGICFPLSILPEDNYIEGQDVTDVIGVKKYDPQAELEEKLFQQKTQIHKNRLIKFFRRYKWYRNLFFKPNRVPFPSFIAKTDEPRIQLFPNICEDEKETKFTLTEKLDGTSGTYFIIENKHKWQFWKPYIFGVCSRNYWLVKKDKSFYWQVAKKFKIKEFLLKEIKLRNCQNFVVQGEIIGPKVQENKYGLKELKFYVFNLIVDGVKKEHSIMEAFLSEYNNESGWPVPLVGFIKCPNSINEFVEISKGKSVVADIPREGVVCRNYFKELSFKVVNPDFLLKYD